LQKNLFHFFGGVGKEKKMSDQGIKKKSQGPMKLLWGLSTFILGLALSGWLTPVNAEVQLCGQSIKEFKQKGVHVKIKNDTSYRIIGHLKCAEDYKGPILSIDEKYSTFNLRGLTAVGNYSNTGIEITYSNTGIEITADNVTIFGGNFMKCETALYVDQRDGCYIEHFKAMDSGDKAIRIRGTNNSLYKVLCVKAGNDCFEIRGGTKDAPNDLEACKSMKCGTGEENATGIQFRGTGSAYRCVVVGSSGDGFKVDGDVLGVTIQECVSINNTLSGIYLENGATGNTIESNIAYSNGDGESTFDLQDDNPDCDKNIWENNVFGSSNTSCID
jgi:parallel beta-helix repeat protein